VILDEKNVLEKKCNNLKQSTLQNYKKELNDLKKEHSSKIEKYEKELESLIEFKNRKNKEDKERKKSKKKAKQKEKKVKEEANRKDLDNVISDSTVTNKSNNMNKIKENSDLNEPSTSSVKENSDCKQNSHQLISKIDHSDSTSLLTSNNFFVHRTKNDASIDLSENASAVSPSIYSFKSPMDFTSKNLTTPVDSYTENFLDYGISLPTVSNYSNSQNSSSINWDTWPY